MATFRMERTGNFTVMGNYHLRDHSLSLKAKGLLSLMLSLPEEWDYTMVGLTSVCNDGLSSIRTTVNELEQHGYLRRSRVRRENGQLGGTEYTILECPDLKQAEDTQNTEQAVVKKTTGSTPVPDEASEAAGFTTTTATISPETVKGEQVTEQSAFATQKTASSVFTPDVTSELPVFTTVTTQSKAKAQTSTSSSNSLKDTSDANVYSIICDKGSQLGDENNISLWRELVMENLAYDVLAKSIGRERADGVVELIVEVLLSRRPLIRIAGDNFPTEAVKSRLLKVEGDHVEYVFECLDRCSTPIRSFKAYLLTSLYNAPVTMDSYYYTQARQDLAKKSA